MSRSCGVWRKGRSKCSSHLKERFRLQCSIRIRGVDVLDHELIQLYRELDIVRSINISRLRWLVMFREITCGLGYYSSYGYYGYRRRWKNELRTSNPRYIKKNQLFYGYTMRWQNRKTLNYNQEDDVSLVVSCSYDFGHPCPRRGKHDFFCLLIGEESFIS